MITIGAIRSVILSQGGDCMRRTLITYAVLLLALLLAVGLTGCRDHEALVKEVKLQGLRHDVQEFARQTEDRSGIFLYSRAGEKQYLIVRHASVTQGEEAQYLNGIQAQVQDHTLNLYLEEQGTKDYQDDRLKRNTRIFELGKVTTYDTIRIYRNGAETSIDLAGG